MKPSDTDRVHLGELYNHAELYGFIDLRRRPLEAGGIYLRQKVHWISLCSHWCCAVLCLVTQLCPALCDLMDCSLLGCSVHGDSPGKNTELVAIPSSRGSSQPRD